MLIISYLKYLNWIYTEIKKAPTVPLIIKELYNKSLKVYLL